MADIIDGEQVLETRQMDVVPVEQHAVQTQPSIDDLMSLATTLLRSGMLPNSLVRPEQVAAIIVRGRELGIGPMEALMSINVVRGKVSSSTQLMLALIYRSGMLEDIKMDRGDPSIVTMKRKGMSEHSVSFGSEDAKRAGLIKGGGAYDKWPEIMYLWRAIAICARVVFPDVVGAVYTPDELGISLRSDENIRDGEWVDTSVAVDGEKMFSPRKGEGVECIADKVAELLGSGVSISDIAEQLGKPAPVIRAIINQAGEQ